MHYFYTSFPQKLHTSYLVTILSSIQMIIAILFIAYASRSYSLMSQSNHYQLTYEKDPNLPFFFFYGIQSFIFQALNIVQIWKQNWITMSQNTKKQIIWWVILINSYFACSCAVNGAAQVNYLFDFRNQIQNQKYSSGLSGAQILYYQSWTAVIYFLETLTIIQWVLGLPLSIILVFGVLQKIKQDGSKGKVEKQINPPKSIALKLDPSFT